MLKNIRGGVARRLNIAVKALCVSTVAAVGMLAATPAIAHADLASGEFVVSSSDEFVDAVDQINGADGGSYTIKLAADISLSTDVNLTKNTVTIVGDGYSLSGGNNEVIGVTSGATLNLGAYDGSAGITLTRAGATNGPLASASGSNTTLNINAGAKLTGGKNPTGTTGVQVESGATANLRGGVISDCETSWSSVNGAAVYVGANSTFKMSSGTISNCEGCVGAICSNSGSIIVTGGTIKGNTGAYGGAIAAFYLKSGFFPRYLDISGCEIVDNTATAYGGAIYMQNSGTHTVISNCKIERNLAQIGGGLCLTSNSSATVDASTSLCNNKATVGGADVYLDEDEDGASNTIKLPNAAAMNREYQDSGQAIDGWYNDDPKYTPSVDGAPVDVSSRLKGELALVASYTVQPTPATVSFNANVKLSGASLSSGLYLFQLKDKDGNVVATARNRENGSIAFPEMNFDSEGTFEYTISQVKGDDKNTTYDEAVYPVTVKVTKNADGTAYVAEFDQTDIEFANVYKAASDPGDSGNTGKKDDASGETDVPSTSDKKKGGKSALPKTGDAAMLCVAAVAAVAVACFAGAGLLKHRA